VTSGVSGKNDPPSILGVVYRGLSRRDVQLLDIFEGDEYERVIRGAHPISGASGADNLQGTSIDQSTSFPSTLEAIQAQGRSIPTPTSPTTPVSIYLWRAGEELLDPLPWDFEQFKREKMHAWVEQGTGAESARWAHREVGASIATDGGAHARGGSIADEYAAVDLYRERLDGR